MSKIRIWVAAILGLSIIITATILGSAFKNRNTADDTINVVGLGTIDFESDEIAWSGSFQAKTMDAKEAYSRIMADREQVKAFFISKGFTEAEFSFGGANIEKSFRTVSTKNDNSYETKTESIFDGYLATQKVTFTAKKNPALMAKIEAVADQTSELINSGIEFNSAQIQYTYSALPSLKHDLIESATEDAKDRATKIIKTANSKLLVFMLRRRGV